MATDVISVWNMALSFCGASDEVQVETENTANANACRRFYEQDRDEMLEDFAWTFAKVTLDLALVETDPTTEWGYAYAYPSNCLTLRRIQSDTRNETRQSRIPFLVGQADDVQLIYTDRQSAVAEYTKIVTDPTEFSPSFAKALAYKLAVDIAPRLTGGDPNNLQGKLEVRYLRQLAIARNNDSNNEQPEEEPESEFTRSR